MGTNIRTSRKIGPEHTPNHTAGLQHHQPRITATVRIEALVVIQEWDDYGNHRLKMGKRYSDWYTYRDIAKLRHKEGWIAGVTDYYSGVLPSVFIYIGPQPVQLQYPEKDRGPKGPPITMDII